MKDIIELESCKHNYIKAVPLMSDKDKNFGSSLVLDLRISLVTSCENAHIKTFA